MITINHKFLNHKVSKETETLIIGTFNPNVRNNEADFYYGRSRNYLWKLLPIAYGENTLKNAALKDKITFIKKYNIDFIDLIAEIKIDEGQENNYADAFIDNKVTAWKEVIDIISSLPYLKRVCFTRKTLAGIPNMADKINKIQQYCVSNNIPFECLLTPSRFYSNQKQIEWNRFFSFNNTI